jgi:GxxExxY protein
MEINEITGHIVDVAIKVHSVLGPGLLESSYEACMVHDLRKRGLKVLAQVSFPVVYDGVEIDVGYRIDLLVEDAVIVELKAVDKLLPIHVAQLLSYLKLSRNKVGLLINFNVLHLRDGIKRMVNKL